VRELQLRASAKITLALDVLQRLPDGYHEIRAVMQQVGLCDVITLREQAHGITVSSTDPQLPIDQRNLAWQAARLVQQTLDIDSGVHVHIDKRIPVAAGLGGGSADAACVLLGLNKMWQAGLTKPELLQIAEMIGYDVCFCILGGKALVTGKGDKVCSIDSNLTMPIAIANPGFGILTRDAYQLLDLKAVGKANSADRMVAALQLLDIDAVVENLHNDFEYSILHRYPAIRQLKEKLRTAGTLGALLSGSGASVFAIAESDRHAKCIAEIIRAEGRSAWSGWTV